MARLTTRHLETARRLFAVTQLWYASQGIDQIAVQRIPGGYRVWQPAGPGQWQDLIALSTGRVQAIAANPALWWPGARAGHEDPTEVIALPHVRPMFEPVLWTYNWLNVNEIETLISQAVAYHAAAIQWNRAARGL
ncbi:MAG: hypothetical protein KKA73_07815 [Chloroflexi bacterium]|nr:hypothetical protein [Chloroflexota bacterium]MBU1747579.1 hypothetical protein [Chloroflexota bacterium]